MSRKSKLFITSILLVLIASQSSCPAKSTDGEQITVRRQPFKGMYLAYDISVKVTYANGTIGTNSGELVLQCLGYVSPTVAKMRSDVKFGREVFSELYSVNVDSREIVEAQLNSPYWGSCEPLWVPIDTGVGGSVLIWQELYNVTGITQVNVFNRTLDCFVLEGIRSGQQWDSVEINDTIHYDQITGLRISWLSTGQVHLKDAPYYAYEEKGTLVGANVGLRSLADAIADAEQAIQVAKSQLRYSGLDEAEKFLAQAKEAKKEGDFLKANSLAEDAKTRANSAQGILPVVVIIITVLLAAVVGILVILRKHKLKT